MILDGGVTASSYVNAIISNSTIPALFSVIGNSVSPIASTTITGYGSVNTYNYNTFSSSYSSANTLTGNFRYEYVTGNAGSVLEKS
jgi:hypothetical protein